MRMEDRRRPDGCGLSDNGSIEDPSVFQRPTIKSGPMKGGEETAHRVSRAALAGRRTAVEESMRASRSSMKCRTFFFHAWWYDLAHRGPWSMCSAEKRPIGHRQASLRKCLRQTQGAFAAMSFCNDVSSRAGGINQWSRSLFRLERLTRTMSLRAATGLKCLRRPAQHPIEDGPLFHLDRSNRA